MNKALITIRDSVMAGQPLVQVISFEEKRVEGHLKMLCEQLKRGDNTQYWDINNGLTNGNQLIPGTTEPIKALEHVIRNPKPGFYIFRDLNLFLKDSPEIVRKLREAYKQLKNNKKTVFLLSPDEYSPDALKKEIDVVTFGLPDYDELKNLFSKFLASMEKAGRRIRLNEDQKKSFVIGVQGLTYDEAYKAFLKVFQGQSEITFDLIDKVHEEKKQLILKEKVLEFYPHKFTLNDMGGLDNLKDWLQKRKKAFSKEAKEFGLTHLNTRFLL